MVDGAELVFRLKTNSADYHDEMNSEHYIERLTEQLYQNLTDLQSLYLTTLTTEYSGPEYSRSEYSRPEYSRSEYSRPEYSRSEYSRSEYSWSEYSRTEYSRV